MSHKRAQLSHNIYSLNAMRIYKAWSLYDCPANCCLSFPTPAMADPLEHDGRTKSVSLNSQEEDSNIVSSSSLGDAADASIKYVSQEPTWFLNSILSSSTLYDEVSPIIPHPTAEARPKPVQSASVSNRTSRPEDMLTELVPHFENIISFNVRHVVPVSYRLLLIFPALKFRRLMILAAPRQNYSPALGLSMINPLQPGNLSRAWLIWLDRSLISLTQSFLLRVLNRL